MYKNAHAASVSRAQQNFVVPIVTPSGTTEYIWTGDRWMQATDGKKAHEPQFWVRVCCLELACCYASGRQSLLSRDRLAMVLAAIVGQT